MIQNNAKALRNWARLACEMKRLKAIFPEHAAEIKQCVEHIAAKIKPAADDAETAAAIDALDAAAESLRLCGLCGFPLDKMQAKYCSVICGSIIKRKNYVKSRYIMLNVKGAKIYLHRLIWEKNNGRQLRKGEVVHHINCDPADNRPSNLRAMSNAEHTALHHAITREQRRALNGNLFEIV